MPSETAKFRRVFHVFILFSTLFFSLNFPQSSAVDFETRCFFFDMVVFFDA